LLSDLVSSSLYGNDPDFTSVASKLRKSAQVSEFEAEAMPKADVAIYNMMMTQSFRVKVNAISNVLAPHIFQLYDESKGAFPTDAETIRARVFDWLTTDPNRMNHVYACSRFARMLPHVIFDPVASVLKPYLDPVVATYLREYSTSSPGATPYMQAIEAEIVTKMPSILEQVDAELEGGRDDADKSRLSSKIDQALKAGLAAGVAEMRALSQGLKMDDRKTAEAANEISTTLFNGLKKHIYPNRVYAVRDPDRNWPLVARDVSVLVFAHRLNITERVQKEIRKKVEFLNATFPDWGRIPVLAEIRKAMFKEPYGQLSSAEAGKILALLHDKATKAVERTVQMYEKIAGPMPKDEPLAQIAAGLGGNVLVNPAAVEKITKVNTIGAHMYAEMLLQKATQSKASPAYIADALMQRIEGWASYPGGPSHERKKFVSVPDVPTLPQDQQEIRQAPAEPPDGKVQPPGAIPPRGEMKRQVGEKLRESGREAAAWSQADTWALASAIMYKLYGIYARSM